MIKYLIFIVSLTLLVSCAYTVDKSQFSNLDEGVIRTPKAKAVNLDIATENADRLDHNAQLLGIMCSAFDYNVRLSEDLKARLSEIDKNGVLDEPQMSDVRVVASDASTTLKCIQTGTISAKCQANVKVSGQVVSKNGNSESFDIEKSKIYASGMELSTQGNTTISICEGASWSIYKANVEAINDIIEMIRSQDT